MASQEPGTYHVAALDDNSPIASHIDGSASFLRPACRPQAADSGRPQKKIGRKNACEIVKAGDNQAPVAYAGRPYVSVWAGQGLCGKSRTTSEGTVHEFVSCSTACRSARRRCRLNRMNAQLVGDAFQTFNINIVHEWLKLYSPEAKRKVETPEK